MDIAFATSIRRSSNRVQNDRTGALFRFLRKNWPRRAIIDVKFEKTRFLTVSGAFLSVAVSQTQFFYLFEKTLFFRKNWWGGFCVFLLRLPVIYVYVPFFGPVPKTFVGTGWIHGVKKLKKTRNPPQHFFCKSKMLNVSQTDHG
jgi:hypothetical protein